MLQARLQEVRHAPQLLELDWRSTQTPSQFVCPVGQHVPLAQLPPPQSLSLQQLLEGMQESLHTR